MANLAKPQECQEWIWEWTNYYQGNLDQPSRFGEPHKSFREICHEKADWFMGILAERRIPVNWQRSEVEKVIQLLRAV